MGKKDQGPIEDDGTKRGYYDARRERRLGITPSDEEVERRRTERLERERKAREDQGR
jgi:hypothetical protein